MPRARSPRALRPRTVLPPFAFAVCSSLIRQPRRVAVSPSWPGVSTNVTDHPETQRSTRAAEQSAAFVFFITVATRDAFRIGQCLRALRLRIQRRALPDVFAGYAL